MSCPNTGADDMSSLSTDADYNRGVHRGGSAAAARRGECGGGGTPRSQEEERAGLGQGAVRHVGNHLDGLRL